MASGVRVSELCDLLHGEVRLHDPDGAHFRIPDAKTRVIRRLAACDLSGACVTSIRRVWSVVLSGYCAAMTRYRLLSGLTALVAVLATAPAASADDASVFNAYNARQGEIDAAADQYSRAVRRATRKGTARAFRGIIRANNRMNAILTTIKSELAAQTASSAHGRQARTHAFREVRWWRRANGFESQAIREGLRGRRARSHALFRRANKTMRRTGPAGRRAVRHFKAVGLTSPLGPISVEMG